MTLTRRRLLWLTTVLTLVLLSAFLDLPSLSRTRPMRVRGWVIAHAASLPTTLDEMAALPVDYRKAAYSQLSPELRLSLWRAQIDAYIQSSPTLTATQVQVLSDVADHLTVLMFSTPQSADLKRLCAQAAAVLPAGARTAFSTLGSMRQAWSLAGLRVQSVEWMANRVAQASGKTPAATVFCDCSQGSWCDGALCDLPCDIEDSPSNCGCFWQYSCDGKKVPIVIGGD